MSPMKLPAVMAVALILAAVGCGSKDPAPEPPKPAPTPAPGATASSDKVGIVDVVVGKGVEAKLGDTVWVQYRGTLSRDGSEFDSTMGRDKAPYSFTLGDHSVIKGWEEGIPGMKVGGERKLHIPASLGYGANQQGKIPPNSDLDFDVKLIYVVKPGQENVIDTRVLKPGTGARMVKPGDKITVDYKTMLMSDKVVDSSFDRKSTFTFTVGNGEVISGMDRGVEGMKLGEVREIVMPPAVAYGPVIKGVVPANSALKIEVTLRSFQ